ncbi:UvrD-helicase domain-containing protein [Sporosalibacterium faouarense]|uniref:UvrD-helicase domain-containing protein n=1 Tax=Sporosalibacterium faouarense TaxID=516123 RepID=UPI00192B870A|nr:UvrD-helicase domain-containing protein [Sporosalibacterium faouarense]
MDFLKGLNDKQSEAVQTVDGPLLVLAGAGSGKTRVLTHRIAYLIEECGVLPQSILAITFTNKAAKEMKERIDRLIENRVDRMWVGTFHSMCVRILRRDIDKLGYNSNFVIFDTTDQKTVMKSCIKELNLNEKLYDPNAMIYFVSGQKDKLIEPDEYINANYNDFRERQRGEIYELYQKKLKSNNALDFDDLINKTVKLFQEYPQVLEFYQKKFQYVLVDEYQDTNKAQYELVRLLSKKHMNICVVGDDDQCVLEDMKVLTPQGDVAISDLKEENQVICGSGHGKTMTGYINKKIKKEYKGPVIRVKTKTGREVKATPNHIVFGKLNPQPNVHYVYLMYKKDFGYRIGQTQGVRSRKDEIINGLHVRLNQEHGDKMWILKVCTDKSEATYYEQLFSFKYGIPTTVFHDKGRSLTLSQKYIDKIFDEINTEESAIELMRDLMLFEEYPHHIPNAVIRGDSIRRIANINFFNGRPTGKESGWNSHRISLNTSGDELKNKVVNSGYPVRDGKRNTWRVETERVDYDEANKYVKKLLQVHDELEVVKKARLTEDKSFYYMPISHLRPSMSIAIINDNKIIEDIVTEVTFEDYNGHVYDISVPHHRHYICNGIAVHNSIYGWRGADVRNILDFEKDFPNTKVIKLEQNYRSTKNILNAANHVIDNNNERKSKRLWTAKDEGNSIKIYEAMNEHDEASYIVKNIRQICNEDEKEYSDFAMLYRTNAQSRVLEEALMKSNIPYRIVGGLKFYDRKEVKDIISYLRLVQNPVDDVSLKRIINVPKRGIGKRTVEKIEDYSIEKGESIYSVILDIEDVPDLSHRAMSKVKSFATMIGKFIAMKELIGVKELIENVISSTGYVDQLKQEDTIEAQSRIENINEFVSVAIDFEKNSEIKTLEEFLANISLLSDIDKTDDNMENSVTLMTLHSAKGLEFPVVFLTGLEDGLFPSSRAFTSENDLEEERRLCYVGITRAEEKLFMTHSSIRTLYGKTKYNIASRFLDEIPNELIDNGEGDNTNKRNNRKNTSNSGKSTFSQKKYFAGYTAESMQKAKPKSTSNNGEVKLGMKIRHKVWGEGTIVQVKGQGEKTEVTVAFEKQGIKKLMLAFAPVEIL